MKNDYAKIHMTTAYIFIAKREVFQVVLFLMIALPLAFLNVASSGNVKIDPGSTYIVKKKA